MIIFAAAMAFFRLSSNVPSIGAGSSLNYLRQVSGPRPPYVLAFTSFFEGISDSETKLQMDRGDVLLSRNKANALKSMLKQLSDSSDAVRTYLRTDFPVLAADPECATIAARLKSGLEVYAGDLDSLKALLGSDPKQVNKATARTAWYRHGASFGTVLVTALKVPHFSMAALKPPVAYNLAPVLYDSSESPVYADVSIPDRAVIAQTFGGKGSVLKKGDEIVSFRDEDDKDWKPVTTWRDILHTPADSDAETKHHISLHIRRGRTTKEVTVGFVASMFYLD